MKKTLLEHHYELRIESLRDDPSVDYCKYSSPSSSWRKSMVGNTCVNGSASTSKCRTSTPPNWKNLQFLFRDVVLKF